MAVTWEAGAGRCCCLTCLMGAWAWFREEGRPLRWTGQAVRVGGRCLGRGGAQSEGCSPSPAPHPHPPAQAGPAAPLMVRGAIGESEKRCLETVADGEACLSPLTLGSELSVEKGAQRTRAGSWACGPCSAAHLDMFWLCPCFLICKMGCQMRF